MSVSRLAAQLDTVSDELGQLPARLDRLRPAAAPDGPGQLSALAARCAGELGSSLRDRQREARALAAELAELAAAARGAAAGYSETDIQVREA